MKLLLVAGGMFLVAGDVVQLLRPGGVTHPLLLALAFICLAPGLTLIPVGVVSRNATIIGAALAVIGAIAGASLQLLVRVQSILRDAHQTDALAVLDASALASLTTLLPGILFPLGLLVLAVALRRSIGNVAALLLALGAILFAVGHAVGILPAAIAGDVILLVAFWMFRP